MSTEEALERIWRQNETIIALLARQAFGAERISEIVMRGKRNPEAYCKVYNLLDGTRSGTELAKIAGVTQQAISCAFQTWENEGIVMNVGSDTQPRFKRLMRISGRRGTQVNGKKGADANTNVNTSEAM